MQKIRYVGRLQACPSREQRSSERTPLDPAEQFQAETFVQLRDVHSEKVAWQLLVLQSRIA